ncbi:MAG TPA: conjugal transfer protein TraD [Alphaproteobacteria bacterium]|nr:conjugal transfer protein TraD [Alphaproteobacteria bacterium]
MTQTSLIEKRKKLEQRKNRLKQLEASLTIQERKNRTRRLIELGGLISKAQLESWNANALLGGLLFLKEKESDAQQMDNWIHKGGMAFSSKSLKTDLLHK